MGRSTPAIPLRPNKSRPSFELLFFLGSSTAVRSKHKMASFGRAAAAVAVRSAARRARSPATSPFQSAMHAVAPPRLRRSFVAAAAALASAYSLMPLHSAVAAARLRSCIAADSSCWSCLSQDFALPR